MPTFAWRITDQKGGLIVSNPQPHTCFAQLAQVPGRGVRYGKVTETHPNELFTIWVASCGTFEETQQYADAINSCESIRAVVNFVLKAHPQDDPDNPFKNLPNMERGASYYWPDDGLVNYWSISFDKGAIWDYVFGIFKFIFKNITYGPRGNPYGDSHKDIIRILNEGGSVLEAIVYAGAYTGNGYGYPLTITSRETARIALKMINEGPIFPKYEESKGVKRLGDAVCFDIHGNHTPYPGRRMCGNNFLLGGQNRTVTLEDFRKQLKTAAGEP